MFTTSNNQFGIAVKALASAKVFSTGSVGWFVSDKVVIDGIRYQAQAQAVVVNSKGIIEDPKADNSKALPKPGYLLYLPDILFSLATILVLMLVLKNSPLFQMEPL